MRCLRTTFLAVLAAFSVSTVAITPAEADTIKIETVDDNGKSAPLGTVDISKSDVQSHTDGWTVTKLPAGPHSISVAHPKYDVEVVSVEVTQGQVSRIIVRIRPKMPLRIRVVDESGADIKGSYVTVAVDGVSVQRTPQSAWEYGAGPVQKSGLYTISVAGTSYGSVVATAAPGLVAEIILPGAVGCPSAAPCKQAGPAAVGMQSPIWIKERPVWPLVVGGSVAGVGLVFGAIFTGLAIENTHRAGAIRSAHNDSSACYAPPMPADCGELSDAVDNQYRFTDLAAVSFSVGGGAAVAGLVAHLLLPKQVKKVSGTASVAPWVGVRSGGLGFAGTF